MTEPASDRLGLSAADEPGAIAAFLERDPGLSLGIWDDEAGLVGALLAGQDGRRGYLYHLVVHPGFRRRGLGRLLVGSVVARLAKDGIGKVHAFIYAANEEGRRFWRALGFVERDELVVASLETAGRGGPPGHAQEAESAGE